jgi:hypothetical protein
VASDPGRWSIQLGNIGLRCRAALATKNASAEAAMEWVFQVVVIVVMFLAPKTITCGHRWYHAALN